MRIFNTDEIIQGYKIYDKLITKTVDKIYSTFNNQEFYMSFVQYEKEHISVVNSTITSTIIELIKYSNIQCKIDSNIEPSQDKINNFMEDNNATEIKKCNCIKLYYTINKINYCVLMRPFYLIQDKYKLNKNESIYKFLDDDIIFNYFLNNRYVHVIYKCKILNMTLINKNKNWPCYKNKKRT